MRSTLAAGEQPAAVDDSGWHIAVALSETNDDGAPSRALVQVPPLCKVRLVLRLVC